MKNKIISFVLSLILVISFSACSLSEVAASQPGETQTAAVNTDEEPPSSTVSRRTDVPDDIKAQDMCVLAYFDALKKNDADKIINISSCSMFKELYSNTMGSDFISELQSIASTYDLMHTTWQLIYSTLSDYDKTKQDPDHLKETIDEFVKEVDPARLADIEVLALGTPLEKTQMPDNLQLGMSFISQRYCLFSIGGKTFCQLFWLVNSPEGYRLVVIGNYNGYSCNGFAKPISRQLFEALVSPETIHEPSQELFASIPEINSESTYLQKIKDTPAPSLSRSKETLNYFAEALARRDTYAALSAFDVKERASNYDLYYSADRMNYFEPYGAYCMTPEYGFYRDINLTVRCAEAAKGIISLMFCFGFDFDLKSEPTTVDYFSAIQKSNDKISSLKVKRSDVFAKSLTEISSKIRQEQAAMLGAGDMEHRIIEYSFNGEKFTGAIALLNYGGIWRIKELSSAFLNLPYSIPVAPSSELDYDSNI